MNGNMGLVVRDGIVDDRDERIAILEQDVRRLQSELAAAKGETKRAQAESARSVAALRKQLSPLYRALQAVFGEIDAVGLADEPATGSTMPPRTSAVWESWKQRLGGGCAKAIDALLVHSDLNTGQLAIATGLHRTTIPKIVYSLNKAGLINKNGGRFSLKQL